MSGLIKDMVRNLNFGNEAYRCDNCKYFRKANEQGGWCMSSPPTLYVIPPAIPGAAGTPVGMRPTTAKNDYCSRHTHVNRLEPSKQG